MLSLQQIGECARLEVYDCPNGSLQSGRTYGNFASICIAVIDTSAILSTISGQEGINLQDVGETDNLFMDAKSSARMLANVEGQYIR
ncbi:hypothetical protein KEM48_006434 [Puccinia striiformis f. sp. tritici PST-130]|nr:hypothetical protein KEM48_006434 [Puccinia striiformis f. sp. tritici PST-130]